VFVLIADKSFGQNIHSLLICRGVLKMNLFGLNFMPQKMMSHFNMLGAIVELRVARDCNRRLIVDMQHSGGF
jgi:hypothetical protein